MTDKVQKIREEVVRMHNLLPIMDGDNISLDYADRICTTLEMYIDSLQEESVNEDLGGYINELSKQFPEVSFAKLSRIAVRVAKWEKEQMMKNAIEAIVEEPEPLWWRIVSQDLEGEFVVKNDLHDCDVCKIIVIK